MSRALVIAAAAVLTPVAVALAITNSDWFSSDSASAALLASDVRPAHPTVGTDASEAELGVAGGPIDCPPAGAGVIDCASGEDPRFQLRIEGDTFEVTGRLDSISNELVRVQGPGLLVEMSRDAGTQVEGGLRSGDPVRVEGTVRDAQQLHALAVALRCEEALTPSPAPAAPQTQQANQAQVNEDCKRGSNGRAAARLKVRDGEAEAKRVAVLSRDGGDLTVQSPSGPLSVHVDDKTDIEGDLASAQEIHIQGRLQGNESILAEEIDVLCTKSQGENDQSGEDERDRDKHGQGDKEQEGED